LVVKASITVALQRIALVLVVRKRMATHLVLAVRFLGGQRCIQVAVVVAIGVVGHRVNLLNLIARLLVDTQEAVVGLVTPQVTLQFLCTRRVTKQVQDHLQFHIR
jgi:hypothetical protein